MQIGMVKEKGWRRPSPFFRPRGTLLLLRHSIFFALSFFHLPPLLPPFHIHTAWLAGLGKGGGGRWRAGVKAPEEEEAEDDFEKKGRDERKRRSWVCFILPSPSTPPQEVKGRGNSCRKRERGVRTKERENERVLRTPVCPKKRRGGGNFAKNI